MEVQNAGNYVQSLRHSELLRDIEEQERFFMLEIFQDTEAQEHSCLHISLRIFPRKKGMDLDSV